MKSIKLLERYANGERNFVRANLRWADLSGASLSEGDSDEKAKEFLQSILDQQPKEVNQ
jgi:hypothetical protein